MSDFLSINFNEALKIDYASTVEKETRADSTVYTPVGGKIFQSTKALFDQRTTRDIALDMLEVKSVDQSFYEAQIFAVNFLNACDNVEADPGVKDDLRHAVGEHMGALRKWWANCHEKMGSFQSI